MDSMDVGVIGVGSMGKNHARIYSELKSVDSLSICDVNVKAADDIAKQYDATVYETIKDMIYNVDAVSVCVPTQYHYNVAKIVLDAQRGVLIEKPMCSTSKEALELMNYNYHTSTIGVGHIERFNPIVPEIKKIMNNPLYIEFKRHNPASSRITGSSVIEDLMIHDIDILTNIFFPDKYPSEINAIGNDDVCSVLMEYNNIPVALSASRRSSKKIRSVYIEEPDFTIEGDFMSQEITIYRKPEQYKIEAQKYTQENIIERVVVNKVEPLKSELSAFVDCVKKGVMFTVTPKQAISNLEFCEDITTVMRG